LNSTLPAPVGGLHKTQTMMPKYPALGRAGNGIPKALRHGDRGQAANAVLKTRDHTMVLRVGGECMRQGK